MTTSTFTNRIQQGKVNNLTYKDGDREGLVSVWQHDGRIILTWEECPAGMQYDESTYTRDERHVFSTVEELTAFLASHNLKPEAFTP